MKPRARVAAIACVAGITATAVNCSQRAANSPPQPLPVAAPCGANSGQPTLAVSGTRLHLAWLSRDADRIEFQHATHADGAWSAPQRIAQGVDLLVNWADVPSLLPLAGGTWAAHWSRRHATDAHAGDIQVAVSADGSHWTDPVTPYRDSTAAAHDFVSLVADPAGGFTCVWLDGRDYAGKAPDDPGAQSQLRAAHATPDGRFGADVVLDPRVCDCCPTAAVRTTHGILIAYRDRSDDELRDIAVVRREASGTWTSPATLHADGWRIAGCPVNGPAAAAAGNDVVIAWFTMAADTAVVRLAFSFDGGATFAAPSRIDDGQPVGRVDVTWLEDGSALAVWIESDDEGRASLRARRVTATGGMDASFEVAPMSPDRASGFPRVAAAADTVWFAWTEPGESSQVRMAQIAAAAITGRATASPRRPAPDERHTGSAGSRSRNTRPDPRGTAP
jgi:hypothetical protein